MTITILRACLCLLSAASIATAQQKADKSSRADPKNAAVLVLVNHLKDPTATSEITRYHSGTPRNIILLPAHSASAATIADALGALVASRGRDHQPVERNGKSYAGDDPNLVQRFVVHSATDFRSRPRELQVAAESFYSQLMAAPPVSIVGMSPSPAIMVRLAPTK